jgi:predicted RNA-binding protein
LDCSMITTGHVKNYYSHIPLICTKCSHNWCTRLGDVVNKGYGCPNCFRNLWTLQRLLERLRTREDLDCSMITEEHIKGKDGKIPLRCTKCFHEWSSRLHNVIKGAGCPECACVVRWTLQRLLERLRTRKELDCSMITEEHIKGKDSKILLRCKVCSYEWNPILHNVVNGNGCPTCKNKTEGKLLKTLQELYSETATEIKHNYSDEWCRNPETGRLLPFDIFMLLDLFKIIFELDGRQHFEVVAHWKNNLEENQDRDIYKTNMALENGHYVIRLNQEEVWSDKGNWKQQLIDLVEEIVSGKFEEFQQFYINKEHWEHFAEE